MIFFLGGTYEIPVLTNKWTFYPSCIYSQTQSSEYFLDVCVGSGLSCSENQTNYESFLPFLKIHKNHGKQTQFNFILATIILISIVSPLEYTFLLTWIVSCKK